MIVTVETEPLPLNRETESNRNVSDFVNRCIALITDNDADFFEFQKIMNKPIYGYKTDNHSNVVQVLKKIFKDFYSNGKSAAYISFIWDKFKLWKDESLNAHGLVFESDAQSEIQFINIRVLFSLLMFDWHNQDRSDEDIFYYLESKFEKYEEAANESLFSKLYETIDAEKSSYKHICLRIIYQYLHEVTSNRSKKGGRIISELKDKMKIEVVLRMKDTEFKKKILKVFVAYWRVTNSSDPLVINLKEKSQFFQLAFMLKSKLTSTFEKDFLQYVERCKRNHGFYYEAKLKADNRLLLYIAQQNNLTKIQSFILRKCPFNEVNATPLTNVQELSKILNLNIYPWNEREKNLLDEMQGTIEEIKKFAQKGENFGKYFPKLKDHIGSSYNSHTMLKSVEADKNQIAQNRGEIDEQLKKFRRCLSQTNCKNNRWYFFKRFKTSRNLLFERKFKVNGNEEIESTSLFEDILSTAGMKDVIELVFDASDTLKNEYILHVQNPFGKRLIDYAIDSNDYMNLRGFIIPNHSNKVSLLTSRHLVKTQNRQYYQNRDMTLFERYMYIRDKNLRDSFFDVPFCLLEELHEIDDLELQTDIRKILLFLDVLHDQPFTVSAAKGRNATYSIEFIEKLTMLNSDEKFEIEYDLNKLLRYTLKYWMKEKDKNSVDFEARILSIGDPMLTMMMQVINGSVQDFKQQFYENVELLFERYTSRHPDRNENNRLIQEDMFILFRVAVKHGRDEIVELVLDYENFENLPFEFPRHNKATQHNYFAARKLLEHGYELSREGVPPYWITEQVLRDYLDSQIEHYDENMVRINMSSMMCANHRKFKIGDKRDVSDALLFNEHIETLTYIANDEEIKCLLQHPVVSTYINIKTYKFQFIHRLNFIFFFFAFMMPYVFLINIYASDADHYSFSQEVFLFICVLSSIILVFREVCQAIWFYKTPGTYLSDVVNQMELFMIFLSWIVILIILTLDIRQYMDLFTFISTLLIIVSTLTMMTMLPFSTVPLYMRMLKNVSMTFFKFSSFFVFIVIAFSVSFFVIFRPKRFLSTNRLSSQLTDSTQDNNFDEDDKSVSEVYQNFDTFIGSFFKTLLMLSGEYTIEPFTLSMTKMIIFFIFVITSFIIFNLIIALAITDVKELTDEAEALNLHHKLEQFVKSSTKWKEFYEKFKLDSTEVDKLNIVERWTVKVGRFVLRNHYYVHKLDTVYLNLSTSEVLGKVNKRYVSPLSTQFGSDSKFIMSAITFQRVKQILTARNEKNYRQFLDKSGTSSF